MSAAWLHIPLLKLVFPLTLGRAAAAPLTRPPQPGKTLSQRRLQVTSSLPKPSFLLNFSCNLMTTGADTHALIRSSWYKMSWMGALALPYRKRGLWKTGSLSGGKASYMSYQRGFSFNTPARSRFRVLREGTEPRSVGYNSLPESLNLSGTACCVTGCRVYRTSGQRGRKCPHLWERHRHIPRQPKLARGETPLTSGARPNTENERRYSEGHQPLPGEGQLGGGGFTT